MNLFTKKDVNEKSENPLLHTRLITALSLTRIKSDVRVCSSFQSDEMQSIFRRLQQNDAFLSRSQYFQGPKMLAPSVYALMATAEEREDTYLEATGNERMWTVITSVIC
jgi:hypothetical protein